jgi:hypothetical protein
MKKVNKFLALGLLATLFFTACEKNDNGPVLTAKEKILTNKIWKLQSLTVQKSDDPTKDSSITKPCSDSALMAFDVFKIYQLADASKSCDSTIVPYDKGTWKLSASGDSLTLQGKKKFIWNIVALNDSTLKATFRDSIAPTNNWLKTITLK